MPNHLLIKSKCCAGLFFFLLLATNYSLFAQLSLNDINLERIPQRKVRDLVRSQYLDGITYFNELTPSCYNVQDSMLYSYHRTSSLIREVVNKVWSRIKSLRPKDEYSGEMVSFGFLYSKKLDKIFYVDDDYRDIEEGEIYFLNLKLLGGIKNIGVALEVTKVDEEKKVIQFCYLSNGVTEGTQEVRLIGTKEGNTYITQETRYRNKSKFREKRLYPIFHQKAVSELHSNIKKLVEGY